MAIIQRKTKEGDVRYIVRVRDAARNWYPTETFDRKVDAERYERLLESERDRFKSAGLHQRREIPFREFIESWKRECRFDVSKGWQITQDQMLRDHILPYIGNDGVGAIRPPHIGLVLNECRAKGLGAQTVKHVYSTLHRIFRDAIEHFELLDQNPVLARYRPRVPIRERTFLTVTESQKLLETCREHPFGAAVWLQLYAGLRPGEVQALRWSSVDFEKSQILIRATYNRKEKRLQEHPKQEDWGLSPMVPQLREFLLQKRGAPEQFVVLSRTGSMLSHETYEDTVKRLCDEAGVKRVTPHELRHSCTELWIHAGASAEDIRRLLNQKSLTATARYLHRTDERLQALAGLVGRGLPGR